MRSIYEMNELCCIRTDTGRDLDVHLMCCHDGTLTLLLYTYRKAKLFETVAFFLDPTAVDSPLFASR
jgi:hypothetical protein